MASALLFAGCSSDEDDATTTTSTETTETTETTEPTETTPVAELTPLPTGPGQAVAMLTSVESATPGELCPLLEFGDGAKAAFDFSSTAASTYNKGSEGSGAEELVRITSSNEVVALEGDAVIVSVSRVYNEPGAVAEGSPECAELAEVFIVLDEVRPAT
jgi:hypothetical protein